MVVMNGVMYHEFDFIKFSVQLSGLHTTCTGNILQGGGNWVEHYLHWEVGMLDSGKSDFVSV